jgi:hypothetical protein
MVSRGVVTEKSRLGVDNSIVDSLGLKWVFKNIMGCNSLSQK